MNTGLNPEVVKTSLDEVLYPAYDYPANLHPDIATALTPELFKQKTIDRAAVIYAEYSGVGAFEQVSEEEEAPIATVRTANKTTKTVKNWKKTLKIAKEFYDDEMHDEVNESVQHLGIRARTTRDEYALDVYAGGFDTTTTPDTAYLWSNSHTALDGTTIDNLETGAFSQTNFQTLVTKLLEQKAQDGELGGYHAHAVAVPPALIDNAYEVLKSELKADITDNNLNYFSLVYPGLRIFTSPFLGSTYNDYTYADTSYYLVGENHGIRRYEREPLYTNLISWIYDDYDRWTYKAGYREEVVAASWEGVVASNGTA